METDPDAVEPVESDESEPSDDTSAESDSE